MKIKLIWIGRTDGDVFDEAIQQYTKKLRFYTVYEPIAIPYLKSTKALSQDEQKKREGDLILKKIDSGDIVVLLDERGKEFTSEKFAQFIQQQANTGQKALVFVIGGAYGFSEAVYARQNFKIALSQLTFPHIMTRLIFAEQLYRAFTILHGEPYHH
ncbi:MAG: 23S rRNA (pseudouridine(1915)-N(3))-methyltransferase RlmH [Bacteroidales bacterium]|jgi:23S rRNA (pseudouridine1915-N3)-methyltransferase|nr:23S rRNA (pseudouridine(1915)-N(3))-methyltransferase RlmH [Bacteroidales bacterium]MBQ4441799.1 23S rRNA (pseudouridine(1915)-N(3))-methyltransferase RlmH [Bacteroidales bacterium]MCR4857796.1 23S rRNA (pseudouridine(1915)-N(3))-methyltransferase RlmH [Bacteroidales bacterium]